MVALERVGRFVSFLKQRNLLRLSNLESQMTSTSADLRKLTNARPESAGRGPPEKSLCRFDFDITRTK